ncbi:transcriptional regulator, TetR family [Quadrisphaera granulorum]|uniref:TetR family transcriptional regulator n=2 Tax=Quadrisphaera granulorum TaxID=317664 RepID=A0A316AAQ6_9ACTN|nr:TetR family transcriptional regulator [Quadrisphaera granulorum]SZE96004.1 transcriptional regulator, TetR family [Quadrisphaera granulorum]
MTPVPETDAPAARPLQAPAQQVSQDGRSTRWEAHRRARREELVQAALRAITQHGPGVGVDEIAAAAGTSKTALYRHFADKEQLYLAVAERVSQRILRDLAAAAAEHTRPRAALGAVIATYLRLVEHDPDVYWFVTRGAGAMANASGLSGTGAAAASGAASDPLAGLTQAVSAEFARAITRQLRAAGLDAATAEPWAHGLVGMVRAAADHWMSTPVPEGGRRTPADVLAGQLTALAWGGLSRAPLTAPSSSSRTTAAGPDTAEDTTLKTDRPDPAVQHHLEETP